ncbi:MAG: PEP/pyruvate-binding domain-containing protein [Candidatus Zixiibacteriota bacterium]
MKDESIDKLLFSLQERAKELNCIYRIEEILSNLSTSIEHVCRQIIAAIPPGWQYPDICKAKIVVDDKEYYADEFAETEWVQSADIIANEIVVGKLSVYYLSQTAPADLGPFLKEETKLIHTIAERLGHFIAHQKMNEIISEWKQNKTDADSTEEEWKIVIRMLRQTDTSLYRAVTRKMLNYLCWRGISPAEELLQKLYSEDLLDASDKPETWNQPLVNHHITAPSGLSKTVFEIASENLDREEILANIKKWVQEDKLSFLVQVVNRNLNLPEVADAIRRYYHLADTGGKSPNEKGILVSLIRRMLSDQLHYINVIKHHMEIKDFYHLLKRVIYSSDSHGHIGGKSAGLYLASQIVKKNRDRLPLLENVKIPKTWHLTSDILLHFMSYNNFEEVVEQKYKDINQVRMEYPHIVDTFKKAPFPPDIAQGLSMVLDDFKDKPLIVRSSSLLEDRIGAAFSGKYKSLFLANRGSKKKRLKALTDAIAEVYASTFSPDPIEYRAERGLLDFGEEMGIIIQEVVGQKVGKYFLPAFAGVAFSKNEFRWSPRINRDDGLLRLVPGLGTRAVDRLSDDYPVLVSPGQPNLRVNVQPEEIYRYTPKKMDVINLETNKFETIDFQEFVKMFGGKVPGFNRIVSTYKENHIRKGIGIRTDINDAEIIATFDGLIKDTDFVEKIKAILSLLEETYQHPVDIEFAHDGRNLYLLQCRSQSFSEEMAPVPIPRDIPRHKKIFTANKYISNGYLPNQTHIVYVDPEAYSHVSDRRELINIGKCVSSLNKLLPKRRFILIGPGRWGSRGDIKLGVQVTYSDINNCSALVEVARQKGNYLPDLSFGTHFFQDLVEAGIRYIPLYPDDEGIVFNEIFFRKSPNLLAKLLPEMQKYADIVKVIDVPQSYDGQVLNILMSADLDEAVAVLGNLEVNIKKKVLQQQSPSRDLSEYWRWRHDMVNRMARDIDADRFGVVKMYLFGSTKNASAGPGSDIDLLIHFRGTPEQREELNLWLTGWSQCLAEINYMRTGYNCDGLLDTHIITDSDIERKTSYAVKINAVTDAAIEVPIGKC